MVLDRSVLNESRQSKERKRSDDFDEPTIVNDYLSRCKLSCKLELTKLPKLSLLALRMLAADTPASCA